MLVVAHVGDVAGLILDGGAGHAGKLLLHQPADLELDGALLGDLDGLEGLGVLRLARLADLGFKTPKSRNSKRLPFPAR
jgi:hypothetical protein